MLAGIFISLLLAGVSLNRNALWLDDAGIWSDAIAKSPRKARAYNELGLSLLSKGEHQKAYAVLSRSLERDPYQGATYINLGLALERMGRIDDAIRSYERAMWMQPADPTAYYNLGLIHYETLRDRDAALGYFLQARDREPREPDVHRYLGLIYREKGDLVHAREEAALYESLRHR